MIAEDSEALYNSPPAIPSTKAISSFLEVVFAPDIYIPIIMFIGLIAVSFLIKKKFFKNVN